MGHNTAVHMLKEHGLIPGAVMETLEIGTKELNSFMIIFGACAGATEVRSYEQGPRREERKREGTSRRSDEMGRKRFAQRKD